MHLAIRTGGSQHWAEFLFALFLLAMLIDIGGAFGLKYAAFGLISLYLILCLLIKTDFTVPVSFVLLEGLLFFVAPIFYLFISIVIYQIPFRKSVGELSPFVIWFLYPILISITPRNKIISIFKDIMFLGAILTLLAFVIIFFLYLGGQVELISKITEFTREYRLGFLGQHPFEGHFSGFFPNVYFRWTLLLIPTAILFFEESKIKLIVIALALFSTLSTAVILFAIIAFIWFSLEKIYRTKKIVYWGRYFFIVGFFIIFLCWAIYLLGYGGILGFVLSKLTLSSDSTLIKIGHIRSIISIALSNTFTFLFGTGLGSSFYSIGAKAIVNNVEVSHFNMIRQFGIIYVVAFFSYVAWLFFRLFKLDDTGRLLAIGLATLFMAAGTNPLLMSPIFFIIMVICRSYITAAIREIKA